MLNEEFLRKQFGTFYEPFSSFLNKSGFQTMISDIDKIYKDQHVYPSKKLLFECFRQCDYSKLELVFIGTEPVNSPEANGMFLTFGKETLDNFDECANFAIEIEEEFNKLIFDPAIVQQFLIKNNVLLLNSSLLRKAHQNCYFNEFFKNFTIAVVKALAKNENIFFCLFGEENDYLRQYISPFRQRFHGDLRYKEIVKKDAKKKTNQSYKITRYINFNFNVVNNNIKNKINLNEINNK